MGKTESSYYHAEDGSVKTTDTTGNFSRTLWIVLVSSTLTIVASSIIAPVINLLREDLGVDPASVGLILTIHGIFVAIFSPVFGVIIDRWGPKRVFVFGLVLFGVGGGSGLFIDSYWPLMASRAVLGIAVAAIINSMMVLIFILYKGNTRDKIMGWRVSWNNLGGVIWPLIGGFLGLFSWHLPFGIYLVGIPLGILALLYIPESNKNTNIAALKNISLWKIFKQNKMLLTIYALSFIVGMLFYVILIFLPQFLEVIGLSDPFLISIFITIMPIFAALTSFAYGQISSKLTYKMNTLLALVLYVIGFSLLSQTDSLLIIASSIAAMGMGYGLILPTITLWTGGLVPSSFRGRIVSIIPTFYSVGIFLAPITFAPILITLGFNGIFMVAAGVCAVTLIIFSLLRGK